MCLLFYSTVEMVVKAELMLLILTISMMDWMAIKVNANSIRTPLMDKGCEFAGKVYPNDAHVEMEEPCLNCTCSRSRLVCFLRMCPPLPDPPATGCEVQKLPGHCCPQLTCVNSTNSSGFSLPTKRLQVARKDDGDSQNTITETSSPPTTARLDPLVRGLGCWLNGSHFAEGSAMISSSFCQYCYCLKGHQHCIRPKCHLNISGCEPRYRNEHSCCPTHYDCSALSRRSTPTTTTTTSTPSTVPPGNLNCSVLGLEYAEGTRVPSGDSCRSCFCVRGIVKCTTLQCSTVAPGCTPLLQPDHCCPVGYDCSNLDALDDDALTTNGDWAQRTSPRPTGKNKSSALFPIRGNDRVIEFPEELLDRYQLLRRASTPHSNSKSTFPPEIEQKSKIKGIRPSAKLPSDFLTQDSSGSKPLDQEAKSTQNNDSKVVFYNSSQAHKPFPFSIENRRNDPFYDLDEEDARGVLQHLGEESHRSAGVQAKHLQTKDNFLANDSYADANNDKNLTIHETKRTNVTHRNSDNLTLKQGEINTTLQVINSTLQPESKEEANLVNELNENKNNISDTILFRNNTNEQMNDGSMTDENVNSTTKKIANEVSLVKIEEKETRTGYSNIENQQLISNDTSKVLAKKDNEHIFTKIPDDENREEFMIGILNTSKGNETKSNDEGNFHTNNKSQSVNVEVKLTENLKNAKEKSEYADELLHIINSTDFGETVTEKDIQQVNDTKETGLNVKFEQIGTTMVDNKIKAVNQTDGLFGINEHSSEEFLPYPIKLTSQNSTADDSPIEEEESVEDFSNDSTPILNLPSEFLSTLPNNKSSSRTNGIIVNRTYFNLDDLAKGSTNGFNSSRNETESETQKGLPLSMFSALHHRPSDFSSRISDRSEEESPSLPKEVNTVEKNKPTESSVSSTTAAKYQEVYPSEFSIIESLMSSLMGLEKHESKADTNNGPNKSNNDKGHSFSPQNREYETSIDLQLPLESTTKLAKETETIRDSDKTEFRATPDTLISSEGSWSESIHENPTPESNPRTEEEYQASASSDVFTAQMSSHEAVVPEVMSDPSDSFVEVEEISHVHGPQEIAEIADHAESTSKHPQEITVTADKDLLNEHTVTNPPTLKNTVITTTTASTTTKPPFEITRQTTDISTSIIKDSTVTMVTEKQTTPVPHFPPIEDIGPPVVPVPTVRRADNAPLSQSSSHQEALEKLSKISVLSIKGSGPLPSREEKQQKQNPFTPETNRPVFQVIPFLPEDAVTDEEKKKNQTENHYNTASEPSIHTLNDAKSSSFSVKVVPLSSLSFGLGSGRPQPKLSPGTDTVGIASPIGIAEDPCYIDGSVYKSGDIIPNNASCIICHCFHGETLCEHVTCPPPPPGCFTVANPTSCCPNITCNSIRRADVEDLETIYNSSFPSLIPIPLSSQMPDLLDSLLPSKGEMPISFNGSNNEEDTVASHSEPQIMVSPVTTYLSPLNLSLHVKPDSASDIVKSNEETVSNETNNSLSPGSFLLQVFGLGSQLQQQNMTTVPMDHLGMPAPILPITPLPVRNPSVTEGQGDSQWIPIPSSDINLPSAVNELLQPPNNTADPMLATMSMISSTFSIINTSVNSAPEISKDTTPLPKESAASTPSPFMNLLSLFGFTGLSGAAVSNRTSNPRPLPHDTFGGSNSDVESGWTPITAVGHNLYPVVGNGAVPVAPPQGESTHLNHPFFPPMPNGAPHLLPTQSALALGMANSSHSHEFLIGQPKEAQSSSAILSESSQVIPPVLGLSDGISLTAESPKLDSSSTSTQKTTTFLPSEKPKSSPPTIEMEHHIYQENPPVIKSDQNTVILGLSNKNNTDMSSVLPTGDVLETDTIGSIHSSDDKIDSVLGMEEPPREFSYSGFPKNNDQLEQSTLLTQTSEIKTESISTDETTASAITQASNKDSGANEISNGMLSNETWISTLPPSTLKNIDEDLALKNKPLGSFWSLLNLFGASESKPNLPSPNIPVRKEDTAVFMGPSGPTPKQPDPMFPGTVHPPPAFGNVRQQPPFHIAPPQQNFHHFPQGFMRPPIQHFPPNDQFHQHSSGGHRVFNNVITEPSSTSVPQEVLTRLLFPHDSSPPKLSTNSSTETHSSSTATTASTNSLKIQTMNYPLSTPSTTQKPTELLRISSKPISKPAKGSMFPFAIKVEGCNVYGKFYAIGSEISQLTTSCQDCHCSETGVQCRRKC